jgi:hypothetical protein
MQIFELFVLQIKLKAEGSIILLFIDLLHQPLEYSHSQCFVKFLAFVQPILALGVLLFSMFPQPHLLISILAISCLLFSWLTINKDFYKIC